MDNTINMNVLLTTVDFFGLGSCWAGLHVKVSLPQHPMMRRSFVHLSPVRKRSSNAASKCHAFCCCLFLVPFSVFRWHLWCTFHHRFSRESQRAAAFTVAGRERGILHALPLVPVALSIFIQRSHRHLCNLVLNAVHCFFFVRVCTKNAWIYFVIF